MTPADYREVLRGMVRDMPPSVDVGDLPALVEEVREHDPVLADKCAALVATLKNAGEQVKAIAEHAKARGAELDAATELDDGPMVPGEEPAP